jgi:LacI family transcriptional regulator
MPNMKQIARLANVSLGTVSNVLNASARVRDPLRNRVLEAVAALDYQPSQLARALRRDKTDMIGMIIPDITNPFFPAVVRGAEDVASSSGYRLVLCNTDNDHTKELSHLNALRTYLPAGLIVIPSTFSDLTAQADSYRKAGTAVVCVDRLPRHWNGDSVTVDNEGGAYRATRLLLDMQHKHIAVITGPLHLTNAKERLGGFRRALRNAKISISPDYIQEASFDKQSGYSKALLLLGMLPRPTAFFAGNDMIALGVLLAIRERGLRCPEDVSLVGFDNLDFAETTSPPLSSVHQPGYQLGATAARILLDRVSGDTGPAKNCRLQTELKIRGSVAILSPSNERNSNRASSKHAGTKRRRKNVRPDERRNNQSPTFGKDRPNSLA